MPWRLKMNAEPEKSSAGLYIVKHETNFLAWLAWETWLHEELQKTFFPHTMTTYFAWPPDTWEKAKACAEWYNAARARIKWSKRVPDNPKPWGPWSREEINDLESAESLRRNPEGGWYPPSPSFGKLEPREGFWRAPAANHERDRLERESLDEWQRAYLAINHKT